ncbi:hypothetical protein M569_11523 [Genlisea aurea]|uniref:SAP30-binding protein n=1 Tax=Genlisea aurea TaxID=192259 RepID=S8DTW8_9LAMI|nr:hypothetical protein M569_11523 [Genlisea aurea]
MRVPFTLVDYGDEEGEMSPEAEDEEKTDASANLVNGEHFQTADGESLQVKSPGIAQLPIPGIQEISPQVFDRINPPESDAAVIGMEYVSAEDVIASGEDPNDLCVLEAFLPPPPKAQCSQELQDKITKFLALKKTTGRSFNSEVRNRKEYRNPDFLLHAVTYQNIDQIGSCFSKDVFDPHGYDKSDFYDEIEADMRRELERKEQERKKSQKIDFASVGIQPGSVVPAPKITLPTSASNPGVTAVNVPLVNSDVTTRDGRVNKKSKWDKVDPEAHAFGGQESSSHAVAALSASKAGGGYATFAQQKRKDAEEKRMMDRKSEKRS